MNEESIFSAAIGKKSPQEREAYLDEACRGNADLRAQVEELLSASNAAGSFFEHPPAGLDVTVDAAAHDTHKPANWDGSLAFLKPCDKPGRIGRLVGNAGEYEIIEVVGSGGMGIVLRAFDTKLSRVVAVKVLAPELARNPTAVKRFLREAKAAAAVVHDHVVTIHNVEESHQPPFLVMQFIDGQTLQQKIDREGTLELKEILRIGCQAAAGLAAAHKHGLVHRDVKPANILLENRVERVKITDFGLARAADDVEITQTGLIAGTPQYMSPEQARGEPMDARGDLFSLGSVLYTMCAGRPAFRADTTMGVIRRVCDDEPRPIREVNAEIPPWLEGIVSKLLAKNPAERYQTAAEVSELLGQCLAHAQNPASVPLPASIDLLHGTPAAQPAAQHFLGEPAAPTLLGALRHRRPLLVAIAVACVVTLAASLILQNPVVSSIAMVVCMIGVGIASYAVTFVWMRSLTSGAHAHPVKEAKPGSAPKPAQPLAGVVVLIAVVMGCAMLMTVLVALGIGSAMAWYLHRSQGAPSQVTPIAESDSGTSAPFVLDGSPAGEWTPLFNGKDLSGWQPHPGQPGAWTVKDNMLVGRGANQYLYTTRDDYQDFRLRAEVKINAQGDSGILVRMAPPSDPPAKESGYEVQLVGNPNHVSPTASIIRHGASVTSNNAVGRDAVGRGDVIRPDQWFALEISAIGGELTVSIDGRQVVRYRDEKPRARGHIALQSFSGATDVSFRKIEIQELPVEKPGWAPLFSGTDLAGWEGDKEAWQWKDDSLVGTLPPHQGQKNLFLWSTRQFQDFELKFKVLLKGGVGNSGVQFQSQVDATRQPGVVTGPQLDIAPQYWANLYHERPGGGWMWTADQRRVAKVLKRDDFNDLSMKVVGKQVKVTINGWTAIDENIYTVPQSPGVIAFQLRSFDGEPMAVTFKDIFIRELTPQARLLDPAQLPDTAEQVLPALAGAWKGEFTQKIYGRKPDEKKFTAYAVNDWIVGQKWLRQRVHMPDGGFVSLVNFEPGSGSFREWFFHSRGLIFGPSAGRWDPTTRTMTWTNLPEDGVVLLTSWRFVDAETVTWEIIIRDKEGATLFEMQSQMKRTTEDVVIDETSAAGPLPPEMGVLDRLVGDWQVTGVIKYADNPAGLSATWNSTARSILGGRVIASQSSNHPRYKEAYGLSSFDSFSKAYGQWLFTADGKVLEYGGLWNDQSQTMKWHWAAKDGSQSSDTWHWRDANRRDWQIITKDALGNTTLDVQATSIRQSEPDWTQLFNGADLAGWKSHPSQSGAWTVKDGVLTGRGEKQYLFSACGDYKNFQLRAEAKINPMGDGGVFVRMAPPAEPLDAENGYEVQLVGDPAHVSPTGTIFRRGTAALGRSDAIKADQWFVLEITAISDQLAVTIDGQPVTTYRDPQPLMRGRIVLQSFTEPTEVSFRKIEIKELPAGTPGSLSASAAPPLAIAPFDAPQAQAHQEAWAKHLGIGVEIENSLGMKLRLIPPGEFQMGTSPEDLRAVKSSLNHEWEKELVASEAPPRRVTIDAPFYLAECEVTVAAFRSFVTAKQYRTTAQTNGKGGRRHAGGGKIEDRPEWKWDHPELALSDEHPVVEVSFKDAQEFCAWLSEKEGRKYVVPSEEQWEFACRAGTATRWFSGDEEGALAPYAWTQANAVDLQPVRRKAPNPFGLREMHGNAEEYGTISGGGCAVRGGSVGTPPLLNRSACRFPVAQDNVWATRGFRVAIVGDLKAGVPGGSSATVAPQEPTAFVWGEVKDGCQVGIGFKDGKLRYKAGEPVEFELKVRNTTDAEKSIEIDKPQESEVWYSGEGELSVKLLGRQKEQVTLKPREEKVIAITPHPSGESIAIFPREPKGAVAANPQIKTDGLATGFYRVTFTTYLAGAKQELSAPNFGFHFDDGGAPPAFTKGRTPAEGPPNNPELKDIVWGDPVMGLSVGIGLPTQASELEEGMRIVYLWNTTDAAIDVQHFSHRLQDWQLVARNAKGNEFRSLGILTGPKMLTRARLEPGQVVTPGSLTLNCQWTEGRAPRGKLPPGSYKLTTNFDCRRLDYGQFTLRITSGEAREEIK